MPRCAGPQRRDAWARPGRGRRRVRAAAAALALVIVPLAPLGDRWDALPAARAQLTAMDVKALLLRKIVTFIRWPQGGAAPRVRNVAVLGRTSFGDHLAEAGAESSGLRVLRARALADLRGAHIVFIAPDQGPRLSAVLSHCERMGALTVADTAGFASRGVAINFYRDARRIRFEINPAALKRAGLSASYKLLSLARIVHDGA